MSAEVRSRNEQIVKRYLEGINSWNFEEMRSLLADNFVAVLPFAPPEMMQTRFEGKDELLSLQEALSETIISENLQDMKFDTLHSDPAEVYVTFRSEMQMVGRREPYRNDYVARFRVEDGLISKFVEYFDSVRLVTGFGGSVEAPQIG